MPPEPGAGGRVGRGGLSSPDSDLAATEGFLKEVISKLRPDG